VTTILVTGANQGLGLAVVDGAARRLGSQADVYLTGRNPARVRAAADRLSGPPWMSSSSRLGRRILPTTASSSNTVE
jgi:carbonyl reductase 1